MGVPALITVSGAIVAANPAALAPIIGMYAANIAARKAYDSGLFNANSSLNSELAKISSALKSSGGISIGDLAYYLNDILRQASTTYDSEQGFDVWSSESLLRVARFTEALLPFVDRIDDTLSFCLKYEPDEEGSEGDQGLAQVIYDKIFGIKDATLQINVVERDMLQDYSETWTMF